MPSDVRVNCCLNSAVLAFLEATCRQHDDYKWRVYDVLAIMRQQREIRTQVSTDAFSHLPRSPIDCRSLRNRTHQPDESVSIANSLGWSARTSKAITSMNS